MGGKVTLINSMLTATPIYRMSFALIPAGTANRLRKLQSNLLWGVGAGGKMKIAWVKWVDLCRKKTEGGLGIKNLRWFNSALIGKWVWRMLTERHSLWAKVVRARHGDMEELGRLGVQEGRRRRPSGWWGKVLAAVWGDTGDWFFSQLKRHVGNGADTSFWHARWCGEQPFRSKFPRLYALSEMKEGAVGEMGLWNLGRWNWELNWRRALNDKENEWEARLLADLQAANLIEGEQDRWCWGAKPDGIFMVKEAYDIVVSLHYGDSGVDDRAAASATVWKALAPLKQQVFAWRLLRDRIPTRDNLAKRMEVSSEGQLCPCCALVPESGEHLFLRCKKMEVLWRKLAGWIGTTWVAPLRLIDHFKSFSASLGGKKINLRLSGLWICITWIIWRWRNKVIFENGEWDFKRMEDEIRCRYWSWCAVKGFANPNESFIEWSNGNLCNMWNVV
ncbi:hypothetical protein OROHE_009795 [Orobanche hederae]